MKKIISACVLFILALAQSPVFADEIIDTKGAVIPCKIETVSAGLVEYSKEGTLYSFQRIENSSVFSDYVDVRVKLFNKDAPVTRHSGQIISKDSDGVIIRNENGDMRIPWYRVVFIGVYKP